MKLMVDRDCPRCNGSGEIARRNGFSQTEVGPGPVPEDARGVYGAKCPGCDGMGVVEVDLNDEIEEWML
jgi:DnaJ-class molecular chaperone